MRVNSGVRWLATAFESAGKPAQSKRVARAHLTKEDLPVGSRISNTGRFAPQICPWHPGWDTSNPGIYPRGGTVRQ